MKFKIKALTDSVRKEEYGKYNKPGDSGLDLPAVATVTIGPGEMTFIEFGISAATAEGKSYFLMPRSSIIKTPLRMANSIGLIDAGYRGPIKAPVDNISSEPYTVEAGTRLFQLVAAGLEPITFEFVDELDETERGAGGFGSTGA